MENSKILLQEFKQIIPIYITKSSNNTCIKTLSYVLEEINQESFLFNIEIYWTYVLLIQILQFILNFY